MSGSRLLGACLLLILLAACGGHRPAPVEERSAWRRQAVVSRPSQHTVQRGDTLYSIAFCYGLDWRELAAWNRIRAPYVIHPGDRLRLSASRRQASSHAPRANRAPPRTDTQATRRLPRQTTAQRERAAPSKPNTQPPAQTPAPKAAPKTATQPPAKPPKSSARAPAPNPAPNQSNRAGVRWRWPVAGPLLRSFNADAGRQGIDIRGQEGDPVMAAAEGVVVYSGTGLIGYGELVIIKHNDRLLSAYGHNRRRLVKEGDRVSAGQAVSEMGKTAAGEAVLHFEIRVEGKPQNPLNYLPRR